MQQAQVSTIATILISNTVVPVSPQVDGAIPLQECTPEVLNIDSEDKSNPAFEKLRERNVNTDHKSTLTGISSSSNSKREKKRNAQKYLASQYSSNRATFDYCTAFVYTIFASHLIFKVLRSVGSPIDLVTIVTAITLAALTADLISGIVHWGCDTWGTIDTPIIGGNLIRSFREHHVDPTAMTRHPFPETNGNSMLGALPVIITLNFIPLERTDFTVLFVATLFLWLSFTNQIHKWAHTYKPPTIVAKLQQWHLILESKSHNFHHFSPYDRDYCITTGWLNPIFQRFQVWKKVEAVVTKYSGVIPRQDDQAWTMQNE
eukprot:TRINITY_DN4774_c0_g1_i1.p1 TRINITY_DN4774_c0_g1~~TRINITY_DN4774_c0_g1_i1.p1  ORF type:complete len:318 (-),score=44.71 TRINITY_DN4774_c0_g1_i1:80-1033(-)